MDPLQFAYQSGIRVDDTIIFLTHRALCHLEKPGAQDKLENSSRMIGGLPPEQCREDQRPGFGFPQVQTLPLARAIIQIMDTEILLQVPGHLNKNITTSTVRSVHLICQLCKAVIFIRLHARAGKLKCSTAVLQSIQEV